jgi:hypothetical protein
METRGAGPASSVAWGSEYAPHGSGCQWLFRVFIGLRGALGLGRRLSVAFDLHLSFGLVVFFNRLIGKRWLGRATAGLSLGVAAAVAAALCSRPTLAMLL